MLYYLFEYLQEIDFPGARMFGYVSFRSLTVSYTHLTLPTMAVV